MPEVKGVAPARQAPAVACAAALLVLSLALAGCDQREILHGLSEREANRVIVVLADAGIQAEKVADVSDEEPRFKIVVAGEDAVEASRVLLEQELPRERARGLKEVFGSPSMIPTDTEEKARLLQAMQGELANTIEQIDGVVNARVHLVLRQAGPLGAGDSNQASQASVLVKYRPPRRETGSELTPEQQRDIYRNMLIALQGDLREVRRGLREELPEMARRDIGALSTIDLYLEQHKERSEARAALAALQMLKENAKARRDKLAYLAALPRIKDLDETLSKIAQLELEALPFASASIRALVAGALAGINPDDVSVLFTPVLPSPVRRLPVVATAGMVPKDQFLLAAGLAALAVAALLFSVFWALRLQRRLKAAAAVAGKLPAPGGSLGGG